MNSFDTGLTLDPNAAHKFTEQAQGRKNADPCLGNNPVR